MASKNLSPVMLKTLQAIQASGGEAHPEQGGWWRQSPDGMRLEIELDDDDYRKQYRKTQEVGTNTILSLRDRGMLEPIQATGNHIHSAYRMTSTAIKTLAALNGINHDIT